MGKLLIGFTVFNAVVMAAALVVGASQIKSELEAGDALTAGLKALGAGLAFFGGALGTGIAQSKIGAAVVGAVAEDPKNLGTGLMLVALPETLVILGFVSIFMIK